MKYQQVSYIENLPELEQIENFSNDKSPKLSSIRKSSPMNESLYNGSGMQMNTQMQMQNMNSSMMMNNPPGLIPAMNGVMDNGEQGLFQATNYMHQPYYSNTPYGSSNKSNEIIENLEIPSYTPSYSPSSIDCRQVFDHISNCPICAKFYKHDNTIYIIVITILIITCALLLKRVLKV